MDDILLNKAAIIERCLKRVAEEQKACPNLDNYTHIDAIILNLERACQATIDMAMHIVSINRLGIPQGSADAFGLLAKAETISADLAGKLKGMVGFRNVAVHEYQGLELDVLRYILAEGKFDLVEFCTKLGVNIEVDYTSKSMSS